MSGSSARGRPLWGLYDVKSFTIDGETLPPLLTDDRRWQNLTFDRRRQFGVRMMDGKIQHGSYTLEGANRLSIYQDRENGDSFTRSQFTFERPSARTLRLEGDLEGSTVTVELTARDPQDFLLLRRGFHWVSEAPFKR